MLGRIYASYLRRRQRLGRIGSVGEGTRIEITARFEHHALLRIGKHCRIGPDCFLSAEGGLTIGDGTIFGPAVVVYSSTHRYRQPNMLPYDECDEARPVVIGRGVWLAHGVMVAPGTRIGDGVVAGLGAVLSGEIPAGSIVVGNPAKVVGSRDEAELQKLLDDESFYMRLSVERGLKRTLLDEGGR